MEYRVLKQFINIDGAFLRVNDAVSCSPERAMVLRKNGMIGGRVESMDKVFPAIAKTVQEEAIDMRPKRRRKRKDK